MAGSYKHITDEKGALRDSKSFVDMIDNLGDAYEAIEEMYGMIWWLASGSSVMVDRARQNYAEGLSLSPDKGEAS